MDGLRRLSVLALLIASCSSFSPTEAEPPSYECVPSAADTIAHGWPESRTLTLVLGSADEIGIDRSVEDGCSWEPLPVTDLTFTARDSSVASLTVLDGNRATVEPRRPGLTWVVYESTEFLDSVSVSVPDTFAMAPVRKLTAGLAQTCAVEVGGRVMCWGGSYSGLLGDPDDAAVGTCFGSLCSPMPKPLGLAADDVFLGLAQHCLVDAHGTLCSRWDPVHYADFRLPGLSPTFVTIGPAHACGLTVDSEAFCWGDNAVGQLGIGSLGGGGVTAREVRGNYKWVSISVFERSTCAVDQRGHLYCWGILPEELPGRTVCRVEFNSKGGRGGIDWPCAPEPLRISLDGSAGADTLAAVAAGRCVLTTRGGVLCAPEASSRFDRLAEAGSFTSIYAGVGHHCGLTAEGVARCWGQNDFRQLGHGAAGPSERPVTVGGELRFESLALGDRHSCGITTEGEVWCWGANEVGQAGGSILVAPELPRRVGGQGGS